MAEEIERKGDGTFAPGKSGNPGGKSKEIRQALDDFRNSDDLRVLRLRLMDLAQHHPDGRVAVAAIKEYHDRAYGKAPQAIMGEDGKPLSFGVILMPQEK